MSEKKIQVIIVKKIFLSKPVEHIDITSFDSREKLFPQWKKCLCF